MKHNYPPPPVNLSVLSELYDQCAPLRPRQIVFVGRVSGADGQDPAASLQRQVARASTLLEQGERITAYYWDIESGRLDLPERGHGDYDSHSVPVQRDGGLADLLDAVERGQMGEGDVAICEDASRPARDMYTSLEVERRLARGGVELLCADEPQGLDSPLGQLMLRRNGQFRAEIYWMELRQRSTDGQHHHAASGYVHGVAPYGYIATPLADKPSTWHTGRCKRVYELDPDPRKPATVKYIFELRLQRRRGSAIATIVNRDLAEHPPPVATTRSAGYWARNAVERVLANPKYTGYMIYNRKSSDGRMKPPSRWIWSPQPTHAAIVDLDTWVRAQQITAELRGVGRRPGPLRIREAAAQRGLDMTFLRHSQDHSLYQIGELQITLPRHPPHGSLPEELVRDVIAEVQTHAGL